MKNYERSCNTCLYMATHEKCDGCLEDLNKGPYNPNKPIHYAFHHYQEGNWMKRIMEMYLTGERSMVIGHQGEAEVNANDTPEQASQHLHYVAEQCGYMCGNLRHRHRVTLLNITSYEWLARLIWLDGRLERILLLDSEGKIREYQFDRKFDTELVKSMSA